MHKRVLAALSFLVPLLAACGDDNPTDTSPDAALADTGPVPDAGSPLDGGADADTGSDAGTGPLEIIGVYASNFGSEEIITDERFNGAAIQRFDNGERWLVTQTSTSSSFNPGLYNRIAWTLPTGDIFYYCFEDFGLPSVEAAATSTMRADPSNPEDGGCGMFSWTRLRRALAIRGEYDNNFGGSETITAVTWTAYGSPSRIVDWDDGERWVITQNPEDAMFGPNLFNRVVYTEPNPAGSFYHCTVEFGLETAAAARMSAATADATDPENSGCGMFPWTRLDRR